MKKIGQGLMHGRIPGSSFLRTPTTKRSIPGAEAISLNIEETPGGASRSQAEQYWLQYSRSVPPGSRTIRSKQDFISAFLDDDLRNDVLSAVRFDLENPRAPNLIVPTDEEEKARASLLGGQAPAAIDPGRGKKQKPTARYTGPVRSKTEYYDKNINLIAQRSVEAFLHKVDYIIHNLDKKGPAFKKRFASFLNPFRQLIQEAPYEVEDDDTLRFAVQDIKKNLSKLSDLDDDRLTEEFTFSARLLGKLAKSLPTYGELKDPERVAVIVNNLSNQLLDIINYSALATMTVEERVTKKERTRSAIEADKAFARKFAPIVARNAFYRDYNTLKGQQPSAFSESFQEYKNDIKDVYLTLVEILADPAQRRRLLGDQKSTEEEKKARLAYFRDNAELLMSA